MSSTGDAVPATRVMDCDDGVGALVRRLRRRQGLSQRRLADRVLQVSGDHAITATRLRLWEAGKDVPDEYWRGWLAMALLIPPDLLERAAVVSRGRRRARWGRVAMPER